MEADTASYADLPRLFYVAPVAPKKPVWSAWPIARPNGRRQAGMRWGLSYFEGSAEDARPEEVRRDSHRR